MKSYSIRARSGGNGDGEEGHVGMKEERREKRERKEGRSLFPTSNLMTIFPPHWCACAYTHTQKCIDRHTERRG